MPLFRSILAIELMEILNRSSAVLFLAPNICEIYGRNNKHLFSEYTERGCLMKLFGVNERNDMTKYRNDICTASKGI